MSLATPVAPGTPASAPTRTYMVSSQYVRKMCVSMCVPMCMCVFVCVCVHTQEEEKRKRQQLKEARIAFLEEEVPALVAKGASFGEYVCVYVCAWECLSMSVCTCACALTCTCEAGRAYRACLEEVLLGCWAAAFSTCLRVCVCV